MWSTALRSSLSSKSLAASICITYANRATVYYTIGIYLVGLMTGTKGDDAACTVRGRDHLRYASLFSPSPFFFSLPRRLRLKYFPSRATLHTYIYTYTRLYTRFDEIRGRTNIAAGTIPEKVCFFSIARDEWGTGLDFIGGNSIRADFLPWKYRIPYGSRPSISRIGFGRYPKRCTTPSQ